MHLDPQGYAALGPIYDAAMDASRWSAALDAAITAAGARAAALIIVDNDAEPYNVRAVGGAFRSMFQTGAAEHYISHLAHYEKAEWEAIGRQRVQDILLDSEISDPDALDQREDYRFLREHAGIRRRLGFRLNDNRAWYDAMTFQFDARIRSIPRASVRQLQPVLPHLAKAVEMGRAFALLRARHAAVLSVLDRVHVGLAVATLPGEVIVSNREADRIFARADGIALTRDRRLVCRDPDMTASLRAFVAEAARTAGCQADRAESLVTIPRAAAGLPLLVEVAPLSDSAGELDFSLVGALITLVDPENPPPLEIGRFARLYGLSEAETDVCGMMVAGLTGPIMAEKRNTSLETVKSQMSSILGKTGTRRRSELIRLAVRTLPPIR